MIPIGNIDVNIAIDKTPMSCAKYSRGDGVRVEVVVRPLHFLRIVAEKGDRHIVVVEDDDTTFEFGDNSAVTAKADLAWAAEMPCNGAHIFPVEIEVAKTTIFTITDQEQRLIIAGVESETVTAVEQAGIGSFARIAVEVSSIAIEAEDTGIAITVGNEDRTIWCGESSGEAPFIWRFESGFWRGCDL